MKNLPDLQHLNRKPRLKPDEVANYRKVPACYLDKLIVLRYSSNTIKTYKDCFCEFINYYSTKDINEITQEEIQAYLLYLVEERQVSTSKRMLIHIRVAKERRTESPSFRRGCWRFCVSITGYTNPGSTYLPVKWVDNILSGVPNSFSRRLPGVQE